MMDKITITGLRVYAYHGVYREENEKGQEFIVNASLYMDMDRPSRTDEITDGVHYGEVCELINSFLQEHTFHLLEKAVTETMREVLLHFPLLCGMEMELCKPNAPILLPFENVSVTRSLFWHTAYIALGSNMGDRAGYLDGAVERLLQDEDFKELRKSTWIETSPYGGVEQDDFLNGVMEVKTLLSPVRLLSRLHEIEAAADRKREVHWGPRTLDLDILFYDDLILDTAELVIPHPDLKNRSFVLDPMCELAPYLRHPVLHKTIAQLREEMEKEQDEKRDAIKA